MSRFGDDAGEVEFFDGRESEGGEVESQTGLAAPTTQAATAASLDWGQIQDAILLAEIRDGGAEGPEKAALAKRLMVPESELDQIREMTDSSRWQLERMKKTLEIEQMKQRGFSWDRLESAVLQKLNKLVEHGKVANIDQLMGIAKLANSATRRGASSLGAGEADMKNGAATPSGVNIQINQGIDGGLPGPGGLGTITLSLSARTVKQLSTGRTVDGESERMLDSVEMLQPEDIPMLNRVVSGQKDE